MMSNPHIPTVEEMQSKVAKHKELKNQVSQQNDNVYFGKIFAEIPYFAEKGAVRYYMDESKLNEFIIESAIVETRTFHQVALSLRNKINDTTEYYSHKSMDGLCVYWGDSVKEKKSELKQEQEEEKVDEIKEEPKKNGFMSLICKIFK